MVTGIYLDEDVRWEASRQFEGLQRLQLLRMVDQDTDASNPKLFAKMTQTLCLGWWEWETV